MRYFQTQNHEHKGNGDRKDVSGGVWRNRVGRGRRQMKRGQRNENGYSEHASYVS